jgi:hypothetical protein
VQSSIGASGLALPMAEADLPPCELGDPPALIYTHSDDLDMDVMMTCSAMGGVADWRSVLTMGGVIFDSSDISGFLAAIGSGLPGTYVLRLVGDAMQFVIAAMHIHPYQDVRVISTATGGSTVGFNPDNINDGGVTLAAAASLEIRGDITLTNAVLLGCAADPSMNLGSVSLQSGVKVMFSDGTTPAVTGELPGTMAAESNGRSVGTLVRAEDGSVTSSLPASAAWAAIAEYPYQGGVLYLLPLMTNPGGDDQDGTNWYIDACTAAGLRAVGCNSGNYATNAQYTQGGRPGGVNGWGDMSCNIDSWITSNTGWTNVVFLQQAGSNLYGDGDGTSSYGHDSPTHPVCVTPP